LRVALLIAFLIVTPGARTAPAFAAPPHLDDAAVSVSRTPVRGDQKDRQELARIERAGIALAQSRWEDALLEMLLLPPHLRGFIDVPDSGWTGKSAVEKVTIERVIGRSWRHVRDLLGAADRPDGSLEMRDLYPRLERIPIVCITAGVAPPANHARVLLYWKNRLQKRLARDRTISRVREHLLAGEDEKAMQLLEPLRSPSSCEMDLGKTISDYRAGVIDRLREEVESCQESGDLTRMLEVASRWSRIESENPQVLLQRQQVLERCRLEAEELLADGHPAASLLRVAAIVAEGEPMGDQLQRLRSRLQLPLRPVIVRGVVPVEVESGSRAILMVGTPQVSCRQGTAVGSSGSRFSPTGRRWSRSPAHRADARRWSQLVSEIVDLTQRWTEATPVESLLISTRREFRVVEALRLSQRLLKTPGRRWRTVWDERQSNRVAEQWWITASVPLLYIDEIGQIRRESVSAQVILSPFDPARSGLPVPLRDVERERAKIVAKLDLQVEIRAGEIARQRLLDSLLKARQLAAAGDVASARELLLPALIGAQEHDRDLCEQGIVEIARWDHLEVETVRSAANRSTTP